MSAREGEAAVDYSRAGARRSGAGTADRGLRGLLLVAGLAGAAGLVLATFMTIISIHVGTTTDLAGRKGSFSGWDRHSVALLLIALVAVPMSIGSWRGSRPAMALLLLLAIAALVISIGLDLPDLHATGTIGRDYAEARAGAGDGYYAETLGAVLLLVAGGGGLLAARPAARPKPRARPRREPVPERPREPESWL